MATQTPGVDSSLLPIATDVEPVSLKDPGAEAKDVFAKCQIGGLDDGLPLTFGMVSGMGRLSSARDLIRFVPLTGREPVLAATTAVWVVQINGDVLQMGGEVWSNPTCIVSPERSGYYATGPVTNLQTGKTKLPEPPNKAPDHALPPLLP